jgi:hypothetical protein
MRHATATARLVLPEAVGPIIVISLFIWLMNVAVKRQHFVYSKRADNNIRPYRLNM